jgi:hypothetical protein
MKNVTDISKHDTVLITDDNFPTAALSAGTYLAEGWP